MLENSAAKFWFVTAFCAAALINGLVFEKAYHIKAPIAHIFHGTALLLLEGLAALHFL